MSRVQGAGWAAPRQKSTPFPSTVSAVQNVPAPKYDDSLDKNNTLLHVKPNDIILKETGEHVLSVEPSGESKISFFPSYLTQTDADYYFHRLLDEIPWVQNSDRHGPQPRLTAWYGVHPYTYSGLTHSGNVEWHPLLMDLREKLEQSTKQTYNSVLCNLYRDGHDEVGWHADSEPALRKNPYIASISLGEVRAFELRKNPARNDAGERDYTYAQHIKMHLPHGSLVIMEGSTQEDWQHRVPREYHDKAARINLTFRTIYPE